MLQQEKDVDQEAIQNFEMPLVHHGEIVAWYPTGNKAHSAETAQVFRVAKRNVHLVTATRGVREAVRHVDDPKLRLNPDQREMGAWDFTESHKSKVAEIATLREEVNGLKRQVASLIGRSVTGDVVRDVDDGRAAYRELKQRVRDAGVEFTGNPSKEWLNAQLEDGDGTSV